MGIQLTKKRNVLEDAFVTNVQVKSSVLQRRSKTSQLIFLKLQISNPNIMETVTITKHCQLVKFQRL